MTPAPPTPPAPPTTVFLNGRYLPADQAGLSALDRGVTFSDGVYEVVRYCRGRAFDGPSHLDRLDRSLRAVRLTNAVAGLDLAGIGDELVRRNGLTDARLYWQITRGPAPRNHRIPPLDTPSVFAAVATLPPLDLEAPPPTATCILTDDVRWHRCDIKSLMLLPNILALADATDAGADDAIFVRDGVVTEATSRNVWAVCGHQLITHRADHHILHGTTRAQVLDLAHTLGITAREQALTPDQLRAADEVFLCSTTTNLVAVTAIDRQPLRRTGPGPITTQINHALKQRIWTQCGPTGPRKLSPRKLSPRKLPPPKLPPPKLPPRNRV